MYNNGTDLSCCASLGLIVYLFLALAGLIWVYQDAEKRGKTGCLWVLLILTGGPLGFIAYLILRNREEVKL